MSTRIVAVLTLIVANSAYATAPELPVTHLNGRNELSDGQCDITVTENSVRLQEFKYSFFYKKSKVAKKIQFDDLTQRFDGISPESGKPYTTFYFEQHQWLNHVKQQVWIYYSPRGEVISATAVQETNPTVGKLSSTLISCLF